MIKYFVTFLALTQSFFITQALAAKAPVHADGADVIVVGGKPLGEYKCLPLDGGHIILNATSASGIFVWPLEAKMVGLDSRPDGWGFDDQAASKQEDLPITLKLPSKQSLVDIAAAGISKYDKAYGAEPVLDIPESIRITFEAGGVSIYDYTLDWASKGCVPTAAA